MPSNHGNCKSGNQVYLKTREGIKFKYFQCNCGCSCNSGNTRGCRTQSKVRNNDFETYITSPATQSYPSLINSFQCCSSNNHCKDNCCEKGHHDDKKPVVHTEVITIPPVYQPRNIFFISSLNHPLTGQGQLIVFFHGRFYLNRLRPRNSHALISSISTIFSLSSPFRISLFCC